ncbi:MAG TPA: MmgE/PrpD family protein [Burkholderiales bacterium]|nr:MmgE/PrpD family protein [Burkholderiales bacterium]
MDRNLSPRTVSGELGAFVAALQWEDIPPEVRTRARHLILDAVGCALAARKFAFSSQSLQSILELAGPGDRAVIGQRLRLPLRDAVLANGLLAHGLDYDDTHTEAIAHLTVSVFPTVLGLASQEGLSMKELLTAYMAGIEAGARLGAVAKGGFHQVGFHPTGVIGAFACALAAGKLYGLDAQGLAQAQGVALSVASGSLEFLEDGAWTKRFHPGWAGVGGIVAAALARGGFKAPGGAYEGRFGLYASYLGPRAAECELPRATAALGGTWETMNVGLKPFPACHFAHAFADAALSLHKEVSPKEIREIRALVPAEIVKTVCEPATAKRRPVSDYDAKFSLPFIIAASLIRGRFGLAELEESALKDPEILELAGKVTYEIDPQSSFPKHYCGEVIVRTSEGRALRRREQVNRGCADRPLSNAEIAAKFAENASYAGVSGPARLARAILDLDAGAPAGELEAALGAA